MPRYKKSAEPQVRLHDEDECEGRARSHLFTARIFCADRKPPPGAPSFDAPLDGQLEGLPRYMRRLCRRHEPRAPAGALSFLAPQQFRFAG